MRTGSPRYFVPVNTCLVAVFRFFFFSDVFGFWPASSSSETGSGNVTDIWKAGAPALDKKSTIDTIRLGGYTFICKHDYTLGWSPKAKDDEWPMMTGGLIIQTGADEFTVAGTGIVITCTFDKPQTPNAGILQLNEDQYVDENGNQFGSSTAIRTIRGGTSVCQRESMAFRH